MRLIVSTVSLLAVAYAVPVIISEERINAILEKLRRAHAIGEFAVNTPTGIYPIKDINRNNLRQIFNFAPASAKDVDTDLEDHKAVPDVNIDSEPVTKEKDEHITTPKDKKTVDKPSHSSEEVKTTKTTKGKTDGEGKGKVTKTTDDKTKTAEKVEKEKSTEKSSEHEKKADSTKSAEESSTHAGKVEATEAAEVTSTAAAESKEATSTASEVPETTPLDVIDEHALSAGANETAPDAGDIIAGKEKNSTETTGTVAEGEEASNKITDATNSTDEVTDPPAGGPVEAAVVTEVKEEVVKDKGSVTLSHEPATVKRSDKSTTNQAHKHLEVEGSGEIHEDVNEGSGTPEDTTSPVVDSTTLLTGNGSEAIDGIIAKGSTPRSLPTITIPQNPEEPYVFVPVQSFKGQQLPGTSYLLIPKKYENKVSDYLTSKTS